MKNVRADAKVTGLKDTYQNTINVWSQNKCSEEKGLWNRAGKVERVYSVYLAFFFLFSFSLFVYSPAVVERLVWYKGFSLVDFVDVKMWPFF